MATIRSSSDMGGGAGRIDGSVVVVVTMDVWRRTELRPCRELCHRECPVRVVADDFERVQVRQQPERLSFTSTDVDAASH